MFLYYFSLRFRGRYKKCLCSVIKNFCNFLKIDYKILYKIYIVFNFLGEFVFFVYQLSDIQEISQRNIMIGIY